MLRLQTLREQRNMTKSAMARELGFSRQVYGNYESGLRTPDAETLTRIANYFKVSVDYLLGNIDAPAIPKNEKIPKDLRKILEDEEIILNGRMLSDDDKQKMLKIIEAAFWEAKELNKRK